MGVRKFPKQTRSSPASQLQIQALVNERPQELNDLFFTSFPALRQLDVEVRWLSPLKSDEHSEYSGSAFLERCGLQEIRSSLNNFLPKGHPYWDAFASLICKTTGRVCGLLLVEAKTNQTELYAWDFEKGAISAERESAIRATQRWLGISESADWNCKFSQIASHLIFLYFFNKRLVDEGQNIGAWMLHLYFTNDPVHPRSPTAYNAILLERRRALEIPSDEPTSQFCPFLQEVFVDGSGHVPPPGHFQNDSD